MKSAIGVILLLASGLIARAQQSSSTCPVSMILTKLTQDRFTVQIRYRPVKPIDSRPGLYFTETIITDQGTSWLDGAVLDPVYSTGTLTDNQPWNFKKIQRGKLLLQLKELRFHNGTTEDLPKSCAPITKAFDFTSSGGKQGSKARRSSR